MSDVHYTISFPRAEAHLIDVTLRLARPDPDGQRLSLPNWIPGSYMIRDFSRHIVFLQASTGDEAVALEKLDKSTWQAPPGLDELRVDCRVYAWDTSVRAAHVDRSHAFFNGTSVFLRPHGRDGETMTLDVERASHAQARGWRVATAMEPVDTDPGGFGRYRAADYDELIDHPFEIGDFTRLDFDVCGVPHAICLTGHAPFDEGRLVRDLARVCEQHVRFFGEPAPMPRYLFLTTLVDSGYGGLEHRASTALLATRDSLPTVPAPAANGRAEKGDGETAPGELATDEKYVEFLGLCSHEYFHTWNVKRIKPARFVPYELAAESYTRLLWFFEGVTSYYDDLALLRAGIIDRERYALLLSRTVTRVHRGPGRLGQSVTDSSFDAWHKFYKQDENAANAIVSYYAKGALVALCLDAALRDRTGGKASLDTLMRVLWARWLVDGAGLAEEEPERVAAEIAGTDLDAFFARALYSTEELPLEESLASLGASLAWRRRDGAKDRGGAMAGRAGGEAPEGTDDGGADGEPGAPDDAPPWLGATLSASAGGATVTQVTSGGPAERAGIAPGDRLLAIERFAFSAEDIDDVLRRHAGLGEVTVHHFRLGRLLESRLPIERAPRDTAAITLPPSGTPSPWLDGTDPSA